MKIPHAPVALRLAAIAICSLCFSIAQAEILTGRVVKISDGDTLTVLDKSNRQHKIRLLGIDAPERKQAFGTVSRQNLADLVFGKQVAVEWHKQDRYQRILGKVLLNGQDVNLKQIKAGLAWHYKQYDRDQLPADRKLYAEAQKAATLKGIGLWGMRRLSHRGISGVTSLYRQLQLRSARSGLLDSGTRSTPSFVGFVGMPSSLPPPCPDSWSWCVLQLVLVPGRPIESMPALMAANLR